MKKALSFLLALLMIFTIVSCAKDPVAPATTPPPPPPADSTAPGGSDPTDTPPAEGGTIGYVTDDVDHQARKTYNIVYFNFQPSNASQQVADALLELGNVYNFKLEQLTANGDSDAYINNLTTTLLKGPDGIFVDITQEYAPRVSELLEEYDVPAICMFNKAVDVDGKVLIPCVIMDQYHNGQTQMQWMLDNYKTYWGDVDFSKVAFLSLDWSTNMDLNMRSVGATELWKEKYPNNPYFYGDTAAESFSVEAGYNVTNAIISANPQIEYWLISGTAEDYTLGATRAVNDLGKSDKTIITSSGAAILSGEWDNGYEGSWKANYSAPPWLYAGVTTFGLLALIDGRATKDTLWPESFLPGDLAPRLVLMPDMMTHENYKDYLSNIKASFGC